MTERMRGTCWSITINNPIDSDFDVKHLPAKWRLSGQMELGKEGTPHYQGMLTTPQVWFSAVKKVLPRAHIELAKNKLALQKYVSKEDTRLAEVPDIVSSIPTLFDYQHTIAQQWNDDEFNEFKSNIPDEQFAKLGEGEIALQYVDTLVALDIEKGLIGVEYIAINPMWRSAWKRFHKSMIKRERIPAENISNEIIYNGLLPETQVYQTSSQDASETQSVSQTLSPT